MFVKEINPYPVSDKVRFRNVDNTITLAVRSDASSIILGLKIIQKRLSELSDESTDEERIEAARMYARVLFGDEQADALMKFYENNALTVISVCGMYFSERLGKIITKAQKKK